MKLRHLFFVLMVSFVSSHFLFGQEQVIEQLAINANDLNLSQHTKLILDKNYSSEEIQMMAEQAPEKLSFLDYYYSASFQLKEGQVYSNDQILLIDVTIYNEVRKKSERVEVLDQASGLYLILDSIDTAGQHDGAPARFKSNSAEGKIANQ